jgi:hypothetical protein
MMKPMRAIACDVNDPRAARVPPRTTLLRETVSPSASLNGLSAGEGFCSSGEFTGVASSGSTFHAARCDSTDSVAASRFARRFRATPSAIHGSAVTREKNLASYVSAPIAYVAATPT